MSLRHCLFVRVCFQYSVLTDYSDMGSDQDRAGGPQAGIKVLTQFSGDFLVITELNFQPVSPLSVDVADIRGHV